MKKRRLVTSALPYVNNVPHLGNLIQVLSADVFARYCRSAGYETLYVCGTDEYGTATETKALEEGVTPQQLCDRFHTIHRDIYSWFGIGFDTFGRTSSHEQTEVTQGIFLDLDKNGFIVEQTIEQLYLESKDMFLADRFVRGECPACGYKEARGDQCESCGKLLEPTELKAPWTPLAPGEKLQIRPTKHLYIDLPRLKDRLEAWITTAQTHWARNAVKMTEAWMRDGLKPRAITRDLKWGIPVPKDGFRNKVFYVWFDAPIGYISMTAALTPDWKSWWQNPDKVELFQFIGKDNIPFHTVVFPSSLLGSGRPWTMLHTMSSTEYLNYEAGKFSKSAGVGVFGNDAMATGIPADVWRFYLFYNRPEKSDTLFTWKDFQERVNSDLIGNLANLVHRTLTFCQKNWGALVPMGPSDETFWTAIRHGEAAVRTCFERAELRDALKGILELADLGNKTFQDAEPWHLVKSQPDRAAGLLRDLVYLVRDLAFLIQPFLPSASVRIAGFLKLAPQKAWNWDQLGRLDGLSELGTPEILFQKLEDSAVEALKNKFAGSQKERAERPHQEPIVMNSSPEHDSPASPETDFRARIDLRIAKILEAKPHPGADKLFIELIETSPGVTTQIVSGLALHYTPEQLVGRHVVLAANLKPAKLRGEVSNGMLLAASRQNPDGGETVEVIFADEVPIGTPVVLEGDLISGPDLALKPQIKIDDFFAVPLRAEKGRVLAGSTPLVAAGRPLRTTVVVDGSVG